MLGLLGSLFFCSAAIGVDKHQKTQAQLKAHAFTEREGRILSSMTYKIIDGKGYWGYYMVRTGHFLDKMEVMEGETPAHTAKRFRERHQQLVKENHQLYW